MKAAAEYLTIAGTAGANNRIAEAEAIRELVAEVQRLNQWADSFTDTHLRERQTGDALIKELTGERDRLVEEVQIGNKLLEHRDQLLAAIPQCADHGPCVPHALEWVAESIRIRASLAVGPYMNCAYYSSQGACCEAGEPCKADRHNDAIAHPQSTVPAANPWKDAVLNQLAAHCMDAPKDATPADILERIICMAVLMATDPAISEPAPNTERERMETLSAMAREQLSGQAIVYETASGLMKSVSRTAPSTAVEREAWLIEVKSLGPSWICSISRENGFTRDANKAIQFPTKESAEAVLAHLWKAGRNGTVFGLDSSCYSVTEHIFLGATPPSHDAGKLVESLDSIRRYGLDTLSGRTDGPDDRDWQRQAVNEMTKRATAALLSAPALPSTALPKIGCVQHDCEECQARAAMPVLEPLTDEQIVDALQNLGRMGFGPYEEGFEAGVHHAEAAHGIGVQP